MAERSLRHTRQITVDIYARDDALWEVEARLIDTKALDYALESGVRPAGDPVHDMTLHLVVDAQFTIVQASARTDWMPYPTLCNDYGDVYTRLAGMNLMRGFRQDVKALAGDVRGCTHLSEMALVLPTAVVQAFAGDVLDTQGAPAAGQAAQKPFQLDRCHALKSDAPAVLRYYPRWYSGAAAGAEAKADSSEFVPSNV
jgi:hypothetical protein